MTKYINRTDAGLILADQLKFLTNQPDVIVLGLPRGGVPVAAEIAEVLHAPLDVFIVRKLGLPSYEELAMGAIAMGGTIFLNQDVIESYHVKEAALQKVIREEKAELERREIAYRGERPFPSLKNKVVILVDDGIATGATMRVAVQAIRKLFPAKIIIAIPVAEKSVCKEMNTIADLVVCPLQPEVFYAVGAWYEQFDQTNDAEVYELLKRQSS